MFPEEPKTLEEFAKQIKQMLLNNQLRDGEYYCINNNLLLLLDKMIIAIDTWQFLASYNRINNTLHLEFTDTETSSFIVNYQD